MPIVIKTTGFDEFLDPAGGSHIKALIMGEHGAGKTPSAACWPQPIIADCENGLMSVASKQVPYATINTSRDMELLLDALRLECLKPAEQRKYRTLVVDTIDSYQRRLIQERLRTEHKDSLSGWADWGWLDAKMIQLIERMLNLPMHVVVNMHVKDVTDGEGDTAILVKKARLKGDIKDSIFQDFDLIGQLEASYVQGTGDKKGERVRVRNIRWHSEPRFPMLRDRSNKLPRFTTVDFTDQDFFRIFDALTEGIDDLPATAVLELVQNDEEDDTEPAAPNERGGPVDKPSLPRPAKKAPAKKTAAKKAPAKKAAAPAEDPWAPDPENLQVEQAKALVKEKLAADVAAEDFIVEETEKELTVESVAASVKEATTDKKTGGPKHCGDQPESMATRGFTAAAGCGRELNAEIASRSQMAVLKAKTYLCDDCFDTFTTK